MDTRRYANLGAKPVKYLKVSCTYNVKSTTSATRICYNTSNLLSMKVDGVPKNTALTYTFDSLGEHFVEFNLKETTVPDRAFSDCTDMQYVEFEDGITAIGTSAFTGCYGLQDSVVIPDSVTSIGNYAFNSCYGITTLTLGNNLVTIGDYAFNGCNKISGELVIPDSVTSIGNYAFRYLYRISSLYLGKNLKNIGSYAFDSCKYMTAIDIPNTVDVIGSGAFYNCIYASGHLHIPDSVTSIGGSAFAGCSALTSINIGQNLTSIGNCAFDKCTNLSGNLTLPDSLLTIGASAFTSCSNLTSVKMPNNINTISNYLFAGCSKLISVENASNITSIGVYAFSGCTELKQFIIPDSVTSIGNCAFYRCSGLTGELIIPDSVTRIGSSVFYMCSGLTDVVIPDSLTSIEGGVFNGCKKLKSINIPESITSIGNYAFSACTSLTSFIKLPLISSIGEYAFNGCSNLTGVEIGSSCSKINQYTFKDCSNLTSVELGSGITSIGNYAFCGCSKLSLIKCESLIAPSISSTTFSGVTNYGTLVYPENSDYSNWLKTDKDYLGYYQWNLPIPIIRVTYDITNVTGVTRLCYSTYGLFPTVTIDGIEEPLSTGYTFDTPGEHIVEYSATTSSVSYSAFSGCTTISYVSISEGIKAIGAYGFCGCSKLKEIILPSTVTSIEYFSFASCPLRKITCYAPIAPTLNTNNPSFSRLEYYCKLIYPEGSDYSSWLSSLKNYKVNEPAPLLKAVYNVTTNTEPTNLTSGLPSMNTMLVDGEEVQCAREYLFDTLGEHVVEWAMNSLSIMAFKNCVNLISVDIPYGITTLPAGTFSGCTGLVTTNLPNSITAVTDSVFSQCSGLTGELIIPDSVISIGTYAFQNCSGLTDVVIGSGCTTINDYAFVGCNNLQTFEIGSGCTSIGNYAFSGCTLLGRITCHALNAPSIQSYTFYGVLPYGTLTYPENCNYSSWLNTNSYYLGYYKWNDPVSENTLTIVGYKTIELQGNSQKTIRIFNTGSAFKTMKVDGLRVPLSQEYTFTTQGEHIVEIELVGTDIPERAFSSTNLDSIIIPEGVTSIGGDAFRSAGVKHVSIPGTVTSLGGGMFTDSTLTTIDLGEGITQIPNAFCYRCSRLTNIVIPDSVTSIDGSAFYECNSLSSVTLGSGLTAITGSFTFSPCNSLSTIIARPMQSPSISTSTFQSTPVKNLYINKGADYSDWIANPDANFNSKFSVHYLGDETVEPELSLDGYDIAVILYPYSTGDTKLMNCSTSYITEISVNGLKLDSVPSTYNFGNSLEPQIVRYKLKSKQVPERMFTSYRVYSNDRLPAILCSSVLIADGVTNIGPYAFYENYKLKNITFPNSLKSISEYAFYRCTDLQSIILPDSVTSILNSTFQQCTNLTSITLGANITSVTTNTFFGDDNINYIHVNEGNPIYDSRENCNCLIETATNTIILGSNNSFIPDTITAIGNEAFKNRLGLTGELIIPDSVTSIGTYAFQSCSGLTSVNIGSGITSIGVRAFDSGSSITTIVVESTFATIGTYAFNALRSLSTVKIGGGVISSNCFMGCTALEYVELGDSVTSLDSYAFSGCTKLDMVKCDSIIAPTIHSTAFFNVPYFGTLVYPEGSDYSSWLTSGSLNDKLWNRERSRLTFTFNMPDYSKYIKIYNGSYVSLLIDEEPYPSTSYSGTSGTHIAEIVIPYDYIPNNAFSGCTTMQSIDIGFKANYIGNSAFTQCSGLIDIVIPDSVTSIGSYAFNGCSGLTDVVIPNSVTSIGSYAFRACRGLTNIVIPDSVTSIGSYAFDDCSGLKSITIGSGCTNLGDCVFNNATKLHSIDCKSYNAPSITSNTFSGITAYGILTYPNTSNYDEWLSEDLYYLGYYQWNKPMPRIIATYDVTTTTAPTRICSGITELSMFINGKEYPTATGFTFDTLGENTVEFETNGASMVNFESCSSVRKVIVPDEPQITYSPSLRYSSVRTLVLGSYVTKVGDLYSCYINEIICHSMTPPSLGGVSNTWNIPYYGTITYPEGSDYSSWFDSNNAVFSDYKWNEKPELLRVTYDVKDNNVTTNLTFTNMNNGVGSYMFVDGERVPFSTRYKFKTKGTHVVDFVLSKPNVIPEGMFYYYYNNSSQSSDTCPEIIKIELPSTITTIGKQAFTYCGNLRTIICHAPTAPSLGSNVFSNVPYYGTLVYPEGSDYSSWLKTDWGYLGYCHWNEPSIKVKTTHNITSTGVTQILRTTQNIANVTINGNTYANITTHTFTQTGQQEIIYTLTNSSIYPQMLSGITSVVSVDISDRVTSIGASAFTNCINLTDVSIPNTVTSIGEYAFRDCIGLKQFIIPDSVTSIGNYAFYQCSGLTDIVISNSVTSIGNYAFYYCSGLTGELIIPDSVASIGNYAFSYCSGLTDAVIGSGCTTLGTGIFNQCINLTHVTIPDSATSIGSYAFNKCLNLTGITIPDSVTSIGGSAFTECYKLKEVTLGSNLATIGPHAFSGATSLDKIYCTGHIAPAIQNTTFANILYYGSLYHLPNHSYNQWLSTNSHYLGYYKWNAYNTYEPRVYYDLTINAEDVSGRATNTTITWSYMTDGVNPLTNEPVTGVQYTGTTVSESFEQNTSETETIERTITFEIMGMTATTTITQGVWKNQSYTVNLNSQWQMSTSIANPASGTYDGVYESFSNKGKHNTAAIMYIDIVGYESFKLYIRSYAESSCDYVMVSQLDQTINNNTSYGNTTYVKSHTSGTQQSGTAIGNYKLVEFTGIDGGEHRITIAYRKDGSVNSGTDQGYVLIPKNQ